jgi:MoaA/NifB/PqqE/SkfB family radical SAM enzyme
MSQLPKKSLIVFSGGEPTFHPEFERIVTEKPADLLMGVVTNAARPLAFWERVTPKMRYVILTYHTEYARFDRFRKVAECVYKTNKKFGRINVTMLPNRWNECVDVFEKFKAEGFPVIAKPILVDFGLQVDTTLPGYTAEQLEWISTAAYPTEDNSSPIDVYNHSGEVMYTTGPPELLAQGQTNFEGWECHTPMDYLMIVPNGNVFDTSCSQKRKVGTLKDGFTIATEPTTCRTTFCWCFSDLASKKVPPKRVIPIEIIP